MRDRSPAVRIAALDLVRETQSIELQEDVRPLLLDEHHMVRFSAVECLGEVYEGSKLRASWLDALAKDSECLVRIETLEAWTKIGDRGALPMIALLLEDEHPLVRSYAAGSISGLSGSHYVESMRVKATLESDESAMVGLASALFDFGDSEYLDVLFSLLHSEVYQVRCAAANSIGAAKLSRQERVRALQAVQYARKNYLFRADQSTMERVEQEFFCGS